MSEPPNGGVVDPGAGNAEFVVPRPGTLNPQPVSVESMTANVEGRHVRIVVTWWSGVEPCYVLDTAAFKKDGNAFTIRLIEGASEADAMCIEIAKQKATEIDLGELEPGEYTVTAQDGAAAPITFTVS